MRPVTLNVDNTRASLDEIQRASHDQDIVELAQNFAIANAPSGQRAFIGPSVQLSFAGIGNTADTNEDTLLTVTLPSSALSLVGEGISILAAGTLANNGDNKTVRLYFGSQVYSLGTVTTAAVSWYAKMRVFRSAASKQIILCEGMIGATPIATSVLTASVTDTGAIIIKVTGQAGTANANDILANMLVVSPIESDVGAAFATWLSDCQRGGLHRTT